MSFYLFLSKYLGIFIEESAEYGLGTDLVVTQPDITKNGPLVL